MPVLHYERRKYQDDADGYGRYSTRVPACGRNASNVLYTRKKNEVTCQRCRRKLGIETAGPFPAEMMRGRPRGRPTAWDRLDASEIDDGAGVELEDEPVDVVPDPVVEPREEETATAPTGVLSTTPRDRLRHRIALVFFHLMRGHLGAHVVAEIANMSRRGITGPGRDYDFLMPQAERLADSILSPDEPR